MDICSECRAPLSEDTELCPACGRAVNLVYHIPDDEAGTPLSKQGPRGPRRLIPLVALALVALLSVWASIAHRARETSVTPSPVASLPSAQAVAKSLGSDVQRTVRDHGLTGLVVSSRLVQRIPLYGRTLVLAVRVPIDVDLSHAAILTMLSIGEIAPSYERELSALEVEYIGLLDGTGRRMFGLVEDYVAYGKSQIDGAELRNRVSFENFLP